MIGPVLDGVAVVLGANLLLCLVRVLRGPTGRVRLLGVLLSGTTGAGLLAVLSFPTLVAFATGTWIPDWLAWFRWVPLTLVQLVLIGYAALWIFLTIDTLRLVRLVRRQRPDLSRHG